MNKNFERYYSVQEIDSHGVDLVHPGSKKVLATYPTYEQARAARDAISADNATKVAVYNAILDRRTAALNLNRHLDAKHWVYVPEMPKKPRLSAVPLLSYKLASIPD